MLFRSRRVPSRMEVTVIDGQTPHRGRVVNVSASGARLHLSKPAALSSDVVLRITHHNYPAKVVWGSDGEYGLAFKRPLDARSFGLLSSSRARPTGGRARAR